MSEPDFGFRASDFETAYSEELTSTGRFNLAIFGKTGVGKSTLINALFGRRVAEPGIGRPVTRDSQLYLHQSGTLGIYDTRGVEIGTDSERVLGDLRSLVGQLESRPLQDRIHVAWYCVRSTDARFEDTEARFIEALARLGLPVMLVLTQVGKRAEEYSPDALALGAAIQRRGLPIVHNRPYLTNALRDPWLGFGVHGLQHLLDDTFVIAPAGVARALVATQQIDFDRKRRAADNRIRAAVGLATAAGATPIPFSDAAILVPIQTGMMGSIAVTYGVRLDASLVAGLAATGLATQAGRSVATSLVKLVPGAGTVIGGTINAAVAAAFTFGMGRAWREVCERMAKGEFGPADALDNEAIKSVFMAEFKRQATNRLRRR